MLKSIWESLFKVKRISASTVHKLQQQNKIGHWQIIDIRDKIDWIQGSLPKAISMPLNDWEFTRPYEKLDKTQTVLIVCAMGLKSEPAEAYLKQRGFEHIFILKRGMQEWYYELEKN